ncbi:hypothetical protein BX600DRAFT_386917 [Xylariales sp. PMI_506]|nr:hypothetical protein BX600DRAFT_386917 [Xylariales sp. PMI_506]
MDSKIIDIEGQLDLILIGAGISGINCSYRLQTKLPKAKFAVFEARKDVGGTWDLFKYPGIRSDSDLHTFGFAWHPWPHATPIAEGPLIIEYMKQCVSIYGLNKYLNFEHKVLSAEWSSKTNSWTVLVDNNGQLKRYKSKFVILGAGYYDYHMPLKTEIPGISNFKGKVIHPQFWPQDYDHSDKKIVVIGSGATAITLVPNLSKTAKHVTMLQRSPSYVVASRQEWPIPAIIPRRFWPRRLLAFLERTWFIIIPHIFNIMCRNFPKMMRAMIKSDTIKLLPARIPWDPHFSPRYNPWDQRLCLAPDGDFFECLHTPRADVVTSTIKTVTEDGIELTTGGRLEADLIVTATGLRMQFGGGIPLTVDGELVDTSKRILWNGAMVQDVPNLFYMIGYTNASWTLGADDTAFIVCRLLSYMQRNRIQVAVPRMSRDTKIKPHSTWDLTSTYVKAAEKRLPKYGSSGPWRPKNNVLNDYLHARWGNITNGLHFAA